MTTKPRRPLLRARGKATPKTGTVEQRHQMGVEQSAEIVVVPVSPPPTGQEPEQALAVTTDTTPAGAAVIIEIPPVEPPRLPVELSSWRICGEAAVGLAHRRTGLPCQDAVAWSTASRPIMALSDGAGSAAVSEKGAQAVTRGIRRLLNSLDVQLISWLDQPCEQHAHHHAAAWAALALRHAQGLVSDIAREERRPVKDYHATLLFVVCGTHWVYWWQTGDGAAVARNQAGDFQLLGYPARTQSEFANQTYFVDTATLEQVQFGVLPTSQVAGIALMSDGGAEKLVAHNGAKVAARVGTWLDRLAQNSLTPEQITQAFYEPAMLEKSTLDDRSVVLMARKLD